MSFNGIQAVEDGWDFIFHSNPKAFLKFNFFFILKYFFSFTVLGLILSLFLDRYGIVVSLLVNIILLLPLWCAANTAACRKTEKVSKADFRLSGVLIWRTILAFWLSKFIALLCALFCIIPGIIAGTYLSLVLPAIVLDGSGAGKSLVSSYRLVRGHFVDLYALNAATSSFSLLALTAIVLAIFFSHWAIIAAVLFVMAHIITVPLESVALVRMYKHLSTE